MSSAGRFMRQHRAGLTLRVSRASFCKRRTPTDWLGNLSETEIAPAGFLNDSRRVLPQQKALSHELASCFFHLCNVACLASVAFLQRGPGIIPTLGRGLREWKVRAPIAAELVFHHPRPTLIPSSVGCERHLHCYRTYATDIIAVRVRLRHKDGVTGAGDILRRLHVEVLDMKLAVLAGVGNARKTTRRRRLPFHDPYLHRDDQRTHGFPIGIRVG